jgi:DNA-binding transcriptional ArsR family regulator
VETPKEQWIGRDAGPIVRPYAMTRGRTRPGGIHFDLVTILVATGRDPRDRVRLSREERRLLELCRRPSTVADLASDLDLPLRVVHVLLGDLYEQGLIEEQREVTPAEQTDPRLLMKVLDDLRRI